MDALFITTNTGSFELQNVPFTNWLSCLKESLSGSFADLVAIHIQELDEKAVFALESELKRELLACESHTSKMQSNSRRLFTVMNSTRQSDEFTALAAVYAFGPNTKTLEIWNYHDKCFQTVPLSTKADTVTCSESLLSGYSQQAGACLEQFVNQRQFPADLFPSGVPSRKGYLRTRWRINGIAIELVNIHLFNDSTNVDPFHQHPSQFAQCRAAGLKWTLDILQSDQCEDQHLVIFGDFNFRLNLPLYIQRLLSSVDPPFTGTVHLIDDDAEAVRSADHLDTARSVTVNTISESDIVIGKKTFDVRLPNRLTWFNFKQFLNLDEEPAKFANDLKELPINFPPSYPFDSETTKAQDYNQTRCPGWCDRVLLSNYTFDRLRPLRHDTIEYDVLGKEVAVGDHKPVYLRCRIIT